MIETETIVDQIMVTKSKVVQIRLGLLLVDGGKVIERKWHRTTILPGDSVDADVAAVNTDLSRRSLSQIVAADIDSIKAIAQVTQTPDVVSAFKASVAL
jgi:hypothetical protein